MENFSKDDQQLSQFILKLKKIIKLLKKVTPSKYK